MPLRVNDSDEHLLRSVETLFAFGPCRLCVASFPRENREGHLDYHRELFEQYAPERRALERAVREQETTLGWQHITPGMPPLTGERLRRHARLYGIEGVKELADAAGIKLEEEKREPRLPRSIARRRKRRFATPEVSR